MSMVSTLLYLEPQQKAVLQRVAKNRGTSLSHEIRLAIRQYLDGASSQDLTEIDLVTHEVEVTIRDMLKQLKAANATLQHAFSDIERIRRQSPVLDPREVAAITALIKQPRQKRSSRPHSGNRPTSRAI